jgi:hypothetical protein
MKKLCRLCQVKLKYIYFFELISSNNRYFVGGWLLRLLTFSVVVYIVYYNIQVV